MPFNPEELFPDPFAADPNEDPKNPIKQVVKRQPISSVPVERVQATERGIREAKEQKERQQSQQQRLQHQTQEQEAQEQKSQEHKKERVKTKEELEKEAQQRSKDIATYKQDIYYSSYYYDDQYAYRHVKLPKVISRWLPHFNLLKQEEWEYLGVEQQAQWEHYMVHAPEPHILLFRREFKGIEEQLNHEEKEERLRRRKRDQGGKDGDKNRMAGNNASRAAKRQRQP